MFARSDMSGLAILILVVTFCPSVNSVPCNWDDMGSGQPFSASNPFDIPRTIGIPKNKISPDIRRYPLKMYDFNQ